MKRFTIFLVNLVLSILFISAVFTSKGQAAESSNANHFSDNFYVYFSLLQNYNTNSNIFKGINTSSSDSAKGSSLGLGFHWQSNIKVEIEVTNSIKFNSDISPDSYSNVKLDLFNVGVLGHYDISNVLSLYGKGGMSYIKKRDNTFVDAEVNSNTEKEIELFVGTGIEWSVKSDAKLRFGYEYIDFFGTRKFHINFVWDF